MKSVSLWTEVLALAFLASAGPPASADEPLATFTSRHLAWSIDAEGRTAAFVERAGGTNLLGAPTPLATLAWNGQEQSATSAELKDGFIVLEFGGTGISVTLSVESHEEHFVIEVVSMHDPGGLVETLDLLCLPLQVDIGPG